MPAAFPLNRFIQANVSAARIAVLQQAWALLSDRAQDAEARIIAGMDSVDLAAVTSFPTTGGATPAPVPPTGQVIQIVEGASLAVGSAVTGASVSTLLATDSSGNLADGPAVGSVESESLSTGVVATQGGSVLAAPWLTLPKGWDAAWKAAKIAGTGSLEVRGDSISAGQNSSNWLTLSFFELLRTYLTTTKGLAVAADYYPAAGQNPFFYSPGAGSNGWYGQTQSPTSPAYEAGFDRVYNVIGTSATETFTSPNACTAIDLVYCDFNSGTWTFTIDGGEGSPIPTVSGATWSGSAWTVTTTGPNTTSGAVLKRVRISGLSSAQHTLVMGSPSATNVCMLVGAVCYPNGNAGAGFGFYRQVAPGLAAVNLTTPAGSFGSGAVSSFPPDKIGLVAGSAVNTGINFTGPPCAPTASIIELGINDCDFGMNLLTFRRALQRLIWARRRAVQNCSICFLIPSLSGNAYSDNATGSNVHPDDWPEYKRVICDLAMTHQCAVVDIDTKWGELGLTLGFQGSGDLHPLTAGHADIATVVEGIF